MAQQLLADAELANYFAIPVRIILLQVIEQTTTFADEHEEAATRAMILLVRLEMLSKFANAFAEDRDLDFRAAGVRLMRTKLGNDVRFLCGCQHGSTLLLLL